MSAFTDCLIVGAGPYGLSLAAHLHARRANFRIVGHPMAPWRTAMPAGMFLKSEGFASSLSEPSGRFTLGAFCAERAIRYADIGEPVSVDTFVAYGETFQKRFVPTLEERTVASIRRTPKGFEAELDGGGTIAARRVVVAAGIVHFAQIPPQLRGLPDALLSHSADHHDVSRFQGCDVAVIGAGSSAMDLAAALRQAGANVTVVARRQQVRFQTPLGRRSWLDKLRAPMTPVGPGWKSVLCTKAPLLFHAMPDGFRTDVVRRYLGPAPAWFTRAQIEGHVPVITGAALVSASVEAGRACLALRLSNGEGATVAADHIIAATGYQTDVNRIGFLDPALAAAIPTVAGAPRLSRHFESGVRGLYFVGAAAANGFGPMLRFVAGADFTARRLSRHLGSKAVRATADRTLSSPAAAAATVDG